MKQVALELFLRLTGIGSASGLVYAEPALYIISDNSTFLYKYDTTSKNLETIGLAKNPSNNIVKKEKPDYEAIAEQKGILYLIGSGSTSMRNDMAVCEAKSKEVVHNDLGGLYDRFIQEANLGKNQLNIEGLVLHNDKALFFQRGNGEDKNNGVFSVDKLNASDAKIEYVQFRLPEIDGVGSSFTDAVAVNDRIFFLASAEDSKSTYLDGEVAGSLVGELDLKTKSIVSYLIIPGKHKFEGITFFEKKKNNFTFLLCEDNDTDRLESAIYKLSVMF